MYAQLISKKGMSNIDSEYTTQFLMPCESAYAESVWKKLLVVPMPMVLFYGSVKMHILKGVICDVWIHPYQCQLHRIILLIRVFF